MGDTARPLNSATSRNQPNKKVAEYSAIRRDVCNTGGTFSGQWGRVMEDVYESVGRLPEWAASVLRDMEGLTQIFVVRSYDTPIGWWTPDMRWTIPNVKYSSSTARQLALLINQGVAKEEGHIPHWNERRWLYAKGLLGPDAPPSWEYTSPPVPPR